MSASTHALEHPHNEADTLKLTSTVKRAATSRSNPYTAIMVSPAILIFVTVLTLVFIIKRQRRTAKLPPGPPRLPIIGNLHQLPSTNNWIVFKKWVKEYGPLVSADFGGTDVIIIGDYETARELLDKRGGIYSDRPRMVRNTLA